MTSGLLRLTVAPIVDLSQGTALYQNACSRPDDACWASGDAPRVPRSAGLAAHDDHIVGTTARCSTLFGLSDSVHDAAGRPRSAA